MQSDFPCARASSAVSACITNYSGCGTMCKIVLLVLDADSERTSLVHKIEICTVICSSSTFSTAKHSVILVWNAMCNCYCSVG